MPCSCAEGDRCPETFPGKPQPCSDTQIARNW